MLRPFSLTLCVLFSAAAPNGFAQTFDAVRLTNTVNAYPHLAPDGARIVFQSNRTGIPQIFVMDADGANQVQLTDESMGAETPKWSPDGTKILFASYVGEGDNDVFMMNPDGSEVQRLTRGPGYDGHPHWSPDGARIIFNSDRDSPDLTVGWGDRWHEIFSMNLDGTGLVKHTDCRAVCTYPSFSPDGTMIAFRKITETPGFAWDLRSTPWNSEVFVANLDGSMERNISANAAFDGWPAWSPDGGSLVFTSNRAGPANVGHLYVADLGTGTVRQVTSGRWSYVQAAWAPDGFGWVAYQNEETSAYEFGDIVVITAVPDQE